MLKKCFSTIKQLKGYLLKKCKTFRPNKITTAPDAKELEEGES